MQIKKWNRYADMTLSSAEAGTLDLLNASAEESADMIWNSPLTLIRCTRHKRAWGKACKIPTLGNSPTTRKPMPARPGNRQKPKTHPKIVFPTKTGAYSDPLRQRQRPRQAHAIGLLVTGLQKLKATHLQEPYAVVSMDIS